MKTIEIHRDDLYKEVWKTPILKLAKKYQISDVGLKKICKKMGIPTPSRGYWAKKMSGKKVETLALPKGKYPQTFTHTFMEKNKNKDMENEDLTTDMINYENDENSRIKVPNRLIKKHSIILECLNPTEHNDGNKWYHGRYDNRIPVIGFTSKEQNDRAIRIMDALLKALEKRNYLYSNFEEGGILLFDQKIPVKIHEPTKMSKITTTDRWERSTKFIPTGKLQIEFEVWGAYGLRKKWADTKTKRLEDQLNDVIKGLIRFAYCKHLDHLKHLEKDRIWKLQDGLRKQINYLIEVKKQRIEVLYKQACDWRASQLYEQYINDVDNCVNDLRLEKERELKYLKWRDFAISQMEMLNPIKPNNMPFDDFDIHIDEKIDLLKEQLQELKTK